jgi:hypothetical protein
MVEAEPWFSFPEDHDFSLTINDISLFNDNSSSPEAPTKEHKEHPDCDLCHFSLLAQEMF